MTQIEQGEVESCPVCGTADIDGSVESFEGVCESCGFVIQADQDSTTLEWDIGEEVFQHSEEKDWKSVCRVRNSTEQQLAEAFYELERFTGQIGLPDDVRESTVDIYCDAFRAELTDGRKTACIVAACLRLASRRVGTPIPKSRLTDLSDVDEKKVHRSNLALCDELDIEARLPAPKEYLPFLQTQLELGDEVWEAAERIVTTVEGDQSIVGKDPSGIAAGAVYLSQDEYTQWDVAKSVGLATETVRQRVKQLRKMVDDV